MSAHLWGVYLVCILLDITQHWHWTLVALLGPVDLFQLFYASYDDVRHGVLARIITYGVTAPQLNEEMIPGQFTLSNNTWLGCNDLLLRHVSIMSCSHRHINQHKQQISVSILCSTVLSMEHGWGIYVVHIIWHTVFGQCNNGSEQLHFWGRTRIWRPGVMGVEEGRVWNFSFLGRGWRDLPHSQLAWRRRGISLCHILIWVNTIWFRNDKALLHCI